MVERSYGFTNNLPESAAQHVSKFSQSFTSEDTINSMIDTCLNVADKDGDGSLSLKEFKEWALNDPLIVKVMSFSKKISKTVSEFDFDDLKEKISDEDYRAQKQKELA